MVEQITGSGAGSEPPLRGTHGEPKGPQPSYWPIILSAGMTLAAIGMVSRAFVAAVGLVVMGVALVGWAWQPWGE